MARHQPTLRSQEKPMLGWATPPRLLGNAEGGGEKVGSVPAQMGRPIGKCGGSHLTPTWPSARWGDPRSSPRRLTMGRGPAEHGSRGMGPLALSPQCCTMAPAPPSLSRVVYTPGSWPPDRRGLTEPRASRAGLAGDRALAVPEVGTSRGQEQPAPSRPDAPVRWSLLCMRDGPEER